MSLIAIIGRGAIGQALEPLVRADGHEVWFVPRGHTDFKALPERPVVVVEAGGHGALIEHGVAVLEAGIPLIAASVGALADKDLLAALRSAALSGATQLLLPSGAIAGIDALAALPKPLKVAYTGTKPSHAWPDGTAQGVFFEGSARDAALQYPKNANVAATLALAGAGFEQTSVSLVSDRDATGNSHEWMAQTEGADAATRITVSVHNAPTAGNAASSALTVHSLHRMVRNLTSPVVI